MIETTLDGKTKDIVQDNIEQLKQLFPEIITEDKIDFDKLREILGEEIDDSNEKYDFTWKGKHEATKIALNPSEGTLRPDKEGSKNWDTTENLYIEGDNLEVLKLLQKSYKGKINCIYIDPPYNTGKDFVYKDNFIDNLQNYLEQDEEGFNISSNPETSGRFHTNWLNMMYPRLKLARDLLSDEGMLFVSINDSELNNLKKLLFEIFGESNYITQFVWQSKSGGSNDEGFVVTETEYVLLFAKNRSKLTLNQQTINDDSYKYEDEFVEERGRYKLKKLDFRMTSAHYTDTLNYPIDLPNGDILYPGGSNQKSDEGWNWRWSQEKLKWGIENKFIEIKETKDNWAVYSKQYEKVDNNNQPIERTIPYRNLIFSKEVNTTQGTSEIKKLFGYKIFEYAKPTNLINKLLEISNVKEGIVLDFFSGSSTTANSVMLQNSKNSLKIKYIMVQLPEKLDEKSKGYQEGYKTICDIAKERIKLAGDEIKDIDSGFKVFKLDISNLTKWNPDVDNLEDSLINVRDNIVEGRTELDLVYEIMLKYGLELTLPVEEVKQDNYTFYSVGMGSLIVCLNDHIKRDVAADVLAIKEDLSPNIMRVVFKDNGFESDSDKTNVKEILRNNEVDEFITI